MREAVIAVDFGGSSGRVMAGIISGNTLEMHEVHRFDNQICRLGGGAYWDFPRLFSEMISGLKEAVKQGFKLLSIGVDTWGVDFGLIDRHGRPLEYPVSYRDSRVAGSAERFFSEHGSAEQLYSATGVQIMDINTLFRLCDMMREEPEVVAAAQHLLFMPDLFSYFLTGEPNVEYTIATTSGLIDARKRTWDEELIERCGLPRRLFGEIIMPGNVRGRLTSQVMREIGVDYEVPVVAVGSHDTASAIVTAGNETCTAFLSSGTWSLLGATVTEPILTVQALKEGFTNEGGLDRSICFLQNITGLWMLQQLIAEWKSEGLTTDYDALLTMARESGYEKTVDVDDAAFHSPHSMSEAISGYCREHGYEPPLSQGDYVICVLRSLALRYKKGVEGLNAILGEPVKRLRIIGGGSRNALLNSLTEQYVGVPVVSGPAEATAIGNMLVQACALGIINNIKEITQFT